MMLLLILIINYGIIVFDFLQLVNIIDVCWGEEPAPRSPAVYRMLDNCLTEVAL